MSTIRERQQKRTKELEAIKNKIIKQLPQLSKREIRRYRIPYEQALIMELEEDGFIESSNYLSSLIKHQDEMREKAGHDSYMWHKPLLKENRELLEKIYYKLKETENGLKNQQKHLEIDHLLSLGLYFANLEEDSWWWLAEQILLQTLEIANSYTDDGGHRQALIRFFYGRFLLKKLRYIIDAEENLSICRELSAGHSWITSDFLRTERSSNLLYTECCELLYQALLLIAKNNLASNPRQSLKLCQVAHKRAIESRSLTSEATCIYYVGICESQLERYHEAISYFQKVLIMYYSINNKQGVCETRMQLAKTHSKLEHMRDANYHLIQLLDYTIKHNLRYYEAQAHRCIGELYLENYAPANAGPHLLQALEIFHELDDYENREHVKNIAAIAAGYQMMLPYRELIRSCADKGKQGELNLMKMVRWKDVRESFYDELPESEEHSYTSDVLHYLEDLGVDEEWSRTECNVDIQNDELIDEITNESNFSQQR